MPKVWNKNTGFPIGAVYVGRPSKWGNPYKIGRDGTREEVVAKFRAHCLAQMPYGFVFDLIELKGKDLVCWCAPLPCHADVLLELANGLSAGKE